MTNLSEIKAFSKPLVANLNKLGISNLQALLLHLPLRYIDETHLTAVRDLRVGEAAQVEGEIVHAEVTYKPRKALIARLEDASGQLTLRFLNFYPSQIATLKVGAKLRVYGEVRSGFYGYEMVHPTCKAVGEKTFVAETLTPVYPTVAGFTQGSLRKAIAIALAQNGLNETLPASVYQQVHLENSSFPSFAASLKALHNPPPDVDLSGLENKTTPEWRRLAFDELLAQQLSMRKHYARRRSVDAPQFTPSKQLVSALLKSLPFALTQAQQKVALEIEHDLTQPHPMQRLLQGDVGSGKTIVACMAALQSIESSWQVALMAPTEILAEQHYRKMMVWLTPLNISIAWLTGSQPKKDRDAALQSIADGSAQLIVGTHALFQEAVQFKKLGLAIIDEQHRFGVQQRLA
ncbi:MAG: ATP-dependent DNA helicase RecG, partial [Betaproteobacteria bacterium HGW-Betaproteobacteria-20]